MAGYYDRDRNPNGAHGADATSSGTMQWPIAHIGSTAEYLVSAWPYSLSYDNSSGGTRTNTVTLEYVTKFITITAVSGNATVSLQGGDNFIIPSGTTQKFEVKATTVAITCANSTGFRLVAGLTSIPKQQYPASLGTQAAVAVTT